MRDWTHCFTIWSTGAAEGCAPRADFDVAYYQEQCQEAGIIVTNPLVHYD